MPTSDQTPDPTVSEPVLPQVPGLAWRPLAEPDVDAWYDLVHRSETHDRALERTARSDLASVFTESWVDLAADTLLGLDADGVPRAYARVAHRPGATTEVRCTLMGQVDPTWRGRGVGRALLAWLRSRARQVVEAYRASSPERASLPGRSGVFLEDQMADRVALARAGGLVASRWFAEMRRDLRDLDRTATTRPVPDGLAVVPVTPDLHEPLRLAHNQAFADHWGFTPFDPEVWQTRVVGNEAFRPDLSLAVVDRAAATDGAPQVVAYAVGSEYPRDWVELDHTLGYTEFLGTVRAFRGRGLASLLLDRTAAAFADRGHRYAELGVDTDSPTGADRLYEQLGYVRYHGETYYGEHL